MINSSKFYTVFFIIYQLEDYWSIMKLSYRPFTFNSYQAFLKNKSGFGKTLCFIFYKMFEKNYLLYSITWPLTSNFHHPVKKIILPTKFHFNPLNFFNFLITLIFTIYCFLALNGQNHSSSDSHHHIKIPISWWADIPRFPTGVENMGGLNRHMGGDGGELTCCWKISVKEFIC